MLCLKYVFFIVNFLLFCCGAVAAGVGIWLLTDPAILQNYIELPIDSLRIVSYVATVVGFVLVIIGFIGCCGVLLDNACVLCLFSTMLVVLLLVGTAVAVVIWVVMQNDTLGKKLKDFLFEELQSSKLFDDMQRNLKCCGVSGKLDYIKESKEIPNGCRNEYGAIYEEGCWSKIVNSLSEKANILAGISSTLAVLGVISIIVSVIILCTMRQASKLA